MGQSQDIVSETFKIRRQLSDQESMWDGFEFGRPSYYASDFDDFHKYAAGDWTITAVGSGSVALKAATDPLGNLLITNAAADDDSQSLQKVGHAFAPASGKKLYYECRVKISDATQSDLLVGICATDTTPLANANSIVFYKADGALTGSFITTNTSVSSTDAGIFTMADDTYIKLGFKVSGTGLVEYWVNDVKKGSLTTNIPTAVQRITIHVQNGEGVAKNASVDYVFCAQER